LRARTGGCYWRGGVGASRVLKSVLAADVGTLFWREGLEPDGGRRDDRGGGRHPWHIARPCD
jgi:hypothetical protein